MKGRGRSLACAAALLAAAVLAVYLPSLGNGFVFDDEPYIVRNANLRAGLTFDGVRWAFTTFYRANWHPLTWLSHLADESLFGMRPAGPHFVNVLLHAAATAALLAVLSAMTGAAGRSAVVAALFAVHPVHVESVAWIAERKDLLSTLLALLATGAYLRHVRRPGKGRFAFVCALYALSLMAKPMFVTLPFVLLLLDWWPLGRAGLPGSPGGAASASVPAAFLRLAREKLPLFALAAAASALAVIAQKSGGALTSLDLFPLRLRLANAVRAYAVYLGKAFWPVDLAAYYPHPGYTLPPWQAALSLLLLAALTALALRAWRRVPAILVGWLWFLGTLVPVLGLVQVGGQALADRYTYFPVNGVFLAAVWGGSHLLRRRSGGRAPLLAVAAASVAFALVLLAATARKQVGFWKDNVTLYTHALSVTERNWMAWFNLGATHLQQGRWEESVAATRQGLLLQPRDPDGRENLGRALEKLGRYGEACGQFLEEARLRPNDQFTRHRAGMACLRAGNRAAAWEQQQALQRLDPFGAGLLRRAIEDAAR